VQLRHVDAWIAARQRLDARYREHLDELPGLRCLRPPHEQRHNYYNFPVDVAPGEFVTRDHLCAELKRHGIHARRYFHPLLSELPMYREHASASRDRMPVATAIANRMLCLPLYHDLPDEDQDRVISVIRHCLPTLT